MMRFLIAFIGVMRNWDMPTRLAFGMGLILQVILAGVIVARRGDVPPTVYVGVVLLAVVMQGIVMWGNRYMVSAYTQARRAFMQGDYAATIDILSLHIDAQRTAHQKVDGDVLVLLGNAQRNLGQLQISHRTLTRIVEQLPQSPFAAYGLGKTLLAMGDYAAAREMIRKSLSFGAPASVNFDSGYACYWLQDFAAVESAFASADATALEAPKAWMMALLLARIANVSQLSTPDAETLLYWQREAALFATTPYGQDVAELLRSIRNEH